VIADWLIASVFWVLLAMDVKVLNKIRCLTVLNDESHFSLNTRKQKKSIFLCEILCDLALKLKQQSKVDINTR